MSSVPWCRIAGHCSVRTVRLALPLEAKLARDRADLGLTANDGAYPMPAHPSESWDPWGGEGGGMGPKLAVTWKANIGEWIS